MFQTWDFEFVVVGFAHERLHDRRRGARADLSSAAPLRFSDSKVYGTRKIGQGKELTSFCSIKN